MHPSAKPDPAGRCQARVLGGSRLLPLSLSWRQGQCEIVNERDNINDQTRQTHQTTLELKTVLEMQPDAAKAKRVPVGTQACPPGSPLQNPSNGIAVVFAGLAESAALKRRVSWTKTLWRQCCIAESPSPTAIQIPFDASRGSSDCGDFNLRAFLARSHTFPGTCADPPNSAPGLHTLPIEPSSSSSSSSLTTLTTLRDASTFTPSHHHQASAISATCVSP